MAKKKETRGGIRKGSGAKPKYKEQTKTIAFRCPMSKVDEDMTEEDIENEDKLI